MNQQLIETIERNFNSEQMNQTANKITDLESTIKNNIRPGKAIFLGEYANAATREIIRQFNGQQTDFTIINSSRDYTAGLVYCGLTKKLIGTAYMHLYPTAGPNRIIQKAFNEGRIEIEGWTILTLIQRLIAGAMGLDCMVTKSMIGSDMAADNRNYFKVIESPFEDGQPVALIKALNPDVAVVHGWASDPYGNIIMGSPYFMGQSIWGARASREGVIATVEKIVSTDFIQEHAGLVTVPGYKVKSVSEVPMGAHPQSMNSWGLGIKGFDSYKTDIPFIADYRNAVVDKDALSAWMEKWVFECPSQTFYLDMLGKEKIDSLTAGIGGDNEEKPDLLKILGAISYDTAFTPNERTVVAASRKVKEVILKNRYQSLLLGVGFSALAGYLAYYQLKKEGYQIKLLIGTGVYGYSPQPGNPQIGSTANIETSEMMTDAFQSYGYIVGGMNNRCLSVLGAAQVDKHGNINSTKVGDTFIAGSGGANDATSAQEVIVITRQSTKRFVDRVDYITSPGFKVKTIVSDKGVYEKLEEDGELILTSVHYDTRFSTLDEKIREVKESCGWDVKTKPDIKEMAQPELEELAVVRCFDPEGYYR